ncbi:hypothetical protein, partial [Spirulina sp.]|uniref:hypothetical protein n=1 Tax=Spirulina sp. TaxID=1157 RepID=UPI003F6F802B
MQRIVIGTYPVQLGSTPLISLRLALFVYLKCAKKTPTIKRVRVELPKVTADMPFSGEMNLHQQTNRATASPLIEFLP